MWDPAGPHLGLIWTMWVKPIYGFYMGSLYSSIILGNQYIYKPRVCLVVCYWIARMTEKQKVGLCLSILKPSCLED